MMIFLQAVAEHAQVQGIYRHKVQVGFSRMAGGNISKSYYASQNIVYLTQSIVRSGDWLPRIWSCV